jgi:acetyl esterase/lipase
MPIHTETLNITARQAFRCSSVLSAGRAGPVSVVLAVHGGAWTSGDRFNKVSVELAADTARCNTSLNSRL